MKQIIGVLAFVVAISTASSAHAAPKVAIFNTGEHLFHAGDLPAPYDQDPGLTGFSAGYRCEVFGLFWAYMAWWDCKAAAVDEARTTYIDAPEIVAAIDAAYDSGDIQTGLWEGKARWLFFLLILFGAGAWVYDLVRGGGDDDEETDDDDDEVRAVG
ncbi:MAG: hypothetical protein KF901_20955 [Myxococcales bacterium]|nr:hypothetical protein [Myxococcales bacterium]